MKKYRDILSRFHTIHERDRHPDRETDIRTPRHSWLSRAMRKSDTSPYPQNRTIYVNNFAEQIAVNLQNNKEEWTAIV